jgi:hypothetical protein
MRVRVKLCHNGEKCFPGVSDGGAVSRIRCREALTTLVNLLSRYFMYDCKTTCLSREEDAKSLVNG